MVDTSNSADLTKMKLPDEAELKNSMWNLCKTMAALRHPETGCPWDLKQTFESLRKYMIEEAYEAVGAITGGDPQEICDELGDVLLQVALNSQLAAEKGLFDINSVVQNLDAKMKRRHPHVFGDKLDERSMEQIHKNWDKVKKQEKLEKQQGESSLFNDARNVVPASLQATKIGKIAKKIDFDWDHIGEVFTKFKEEVSELETEIEKIKNISQRPTHSESTSSLDDLQDEIGDVAFTLAQICRHAGIDWELAQLHGNRKFLTRFEKVEKIARAAGIDLGSCSREIKEDLWNQAKSDGTNN